ncbi:MAG: CotH kinase family protein [Akkermansiaceae bacterium]
MSFRSIFSYTLTLLLTASSLPAQQPPRGPGGPSGGRPGGGGPGQEEEVELLKEHDKDNNGWLNQQERAEARKTLKTTRESKQDTGRGNRKRGPRGNSLPPAKAGPKVSPQDVKHYPGASLYDTDTLRTIFLTFENPDWETELEDFKTTDVEVPATMIVDGKDYQPVGVSFRGASSYFRISKGHKRSLNISTDLVDEDQKLYDHKTLNLLNGNGDASLMSTVLYSELASKHIPVPKANFVKVVINGEYWGVYTNVQQFNKDFTKSNYGSSKGTRWKVPGSPRGDGGLAYDGDELAPYKQRYDMKSNDGTKSWNKLINLCRILNETPLESLEQKLTPILNIDEALWFIAYDIVFGNSDGYWTRASDYYIFRDKDDQFHVIPHDMNEAFRGHQRRGDETGGAKLDPLTGLDDARKPLRSRLLKVPALRQRYLANIKEIAQKQLDWDYIGTRIAKHRDLIKDAVKQDTRKLSSYEDFLKATTTDTTPASNGPAGSLQNYISQRRAFLLQK